MRYSITALSALFFVALASGAALPDANAAPEAVAMAETAAAAEPIADASVLERDTDAAAAKCVNGKSFKKQKKCLDYCRPFGGNCRGLLDPTEYLCDCNPPN